MIDASRFRICTEKPRVFILSDISNEPDDAESLCRYLLYSNEFDTRGLVACTSTWMRDAVHPEDMETIVNAYAEVVDNLNVHVHPSNQYASGDSFRSLIKTGPVLYGKEALREGVPLSDGSKALIEQVDESSQPLWVLCWGGTNVLAQALQHVQQYRSQSESRHFRSKLRVYAISDQDDTGLWIRITFPDVFYICSIHGWNQYRMATWIGISGEKMIAFDEGGPDFTKVSSKWLKEHIQIGPLGQAYPDFKFIMEGDTPTFLYLIQNGLGSSEHPEWGSWGGRYESTDLGGAARHFSDTYDKVIGVNGQTYNSNQGTIWRWRNEYQDSFAARIQWTLINDPSKANHAPIAIVNGSAPGPEPLFLDAEAGTDIVLDASESYDPDGDELNFHWFHYKEVPSTTGWMATGMWNKPISFQNLDPEREGRKVKVQLPSPEASAVNMVTGKAMEKGQVLHFILQLKDNGNPPLTTYKRVVLQTTNKYLRGGREMVVETVTAALDLINNGQF
ncbi:DUF1593 domain-containing protein [Trichoderma evansii]